MTNTDSLLSLNAELSSSSVGDHGAILVMCCVLVGWCCYTGNLQFLLSLADLFCDGVIFGSGPLDMCVMLHSHAHGQNRSIIDITTHLLHAQVTQVCH